MLFVMSWLLRQINSTGRLTSSTRLSTSTGLYPKDPIEACQVRGTPIDKHSRLGSHFLLRVMPDDTGRLHD